MFLLKNMYEIWISLFLTVVPFSLTSLDDTFLTTIDNTDGFYNEYRIPITITPLSYDIRLNVPAEALSGGDTMYSGSVTILFKVSEPTNIINLNSLVNLLNITLKQNDLPLEITNHTVYPSTETLTILLPKVLSVDLNYTLVIYYLSNVDPVSMKGFYRSEYNNLEGIKEYLGTTQLEATNARRVFPCFDEPSFKSVFKLTIEYPLGFTAVANTPIKKSSNSLTTTTTIFEDTPIFSTYLLAFTISKFTCTHNDVTQNIFTSSDPLFKIPHKVCSRINFVEDRKLALDYGNQLLKALDTWTNYPYTSMNIGKMDQFAIPDFSAGAMENWGLVNYREYLLLYNPEYTSNMLKQRIISVIAHEFTHMWFGNLVTCQWWSYTFLNEGFARYFQYFLLNKIPGLESLEIDKQFIIEQQQTAFIEDSYSSCPSLTSNAWTPAQISNKFTTLSYNKGSSILRKRNWFNHIPNSPSKIFKKQCQSIILNCVCPNMCCDVFIIRRKPNKDEEEEEECQLSNDNYNTMSNNNVFEKPKIKHSANNVATPEILWNTISSEFGSEVLPKGVNFSQVMDNWTNKPGFPVITASVSGNNIVLTQRRFLYNSNYNDSTQWYIPITFITSNQTTMTTPIWLEPSKSVILENVSENNWIVINHNSAGYYRVQYDNFLRSKLEKVLLDNHLVLTNIDRAQILDDALNLARAGEIKYSEAFKLLSYLKNERCYYPWYVVIRGLNYLTVKLGIDTILGQQVASMLVENINNVFANISSLDLNTIDHVDSLKLQLVWSVACRLGHPTCISEAKKKFQDFRVNNKSVNPNIRDVVYCNALRYSDNITTDWNFLWKRLHTVDQPHETLYILMGLGCAKNKQLLSNYLDQSINSSSIIRIQDLATVWSAVYSSGTVGLEVAFKKFRDNYNAILNHYAGAISVISGIAERLTNNAELKQLENLIKESGENSTVGKVCTAALASAKDNLRWQLNISSDLEAHFNITGNSSSTRYGDTFFVLIIGIFIFICNEIF